jgi:hypothetical protein
VATFIERLPLRRIGLKPFAIGGQVWELEIGDAARDPPADLTAHLPIARPAQIETWHRPLEERYAIGVPHPGSRLLRFLPGGVGAGSVTATASEAGNVSCNPSSNALSNCSLLSFFLA